MHLAERCPVMIDAIYLKAVDDSFPPCVGNRLGRPAKMRTHSKSRSMSCSRRN